MSMELYSPFVNSVKSIMMQMAHIDLAASGTLYSENDEIVSYGVSSIITFSGKTKGRLLLDVEPGLATTIAQNVLGVYYGSAKDYMVLAVISELNNTIAGDAITCINDKHSLGLRLAPPVVFSGKDTVVSIPKVSSLSVDCITKYGKLKINIAFERSL